MNRLMSDTGTAALSKQSGVEWAKVNLAPDGRAYGEIEGDDNAYQICPVCGEYEVLKNPPEWSDFPLTHIKDRHNHGES